MKKLLLLSVAVLGILCQSGCQCGPLRLWLQCMRARHAAEACTMCDTCDPTCGSCATGPVLPDPYLPPATIVPATPTPGPVQ